MSQLSTVPARISPFSARRRMPGTLSSSQRSFVPEKYASMRRPVLSVTTGPRPSAFSRSQRGAVRRHCQTMALWTGSPVRASHSMVVSRWLVMPMAAICLGSMWALSTASARARFSVAQISMGSCSTQPGWG